MSRRTIRIYHQWADRQLSRYEAAKYLATGCLPEQFGKQSMIPDAVEAYYQASPERQKIVYSSLPVSVAVGHMVQHESPTPVSSWRPTWDGWEPIFGLAVEITPFDWDKFKASNEDADDIRIHTSERAHRLDDAMSLHNAIQIACVIVREAGAMIRTLKQ
jgi:hypothetical protein